MKITLTTVGLLSLSALLGCSGSGFEDDGTDDSSDVGGDAAGGEFHLIQLPVDDACGLSNSESMRMSSVPVTRAKDGKSFTFGAGDDIEAKCTADGDSFTCAPIEDVLVDETTAKVVVKLEYGAIWDGNDAFRGVWEASLSCTGADCADFEADLNGAKFPCKSTGVVFAYRALPQNFAPELGTYKADVTSSFSTCKNFAPPVQQTLTIESQDGRNAKVTSDDGQGVAHECVFEGKGRTTCTRNLDQLKGLTETNLVSTSIVDLAWLGPNKFEGGAFQLVSCADGADCSNSSLGTLPCVGFYIVEGTAAAK